MTLPEEVADCVVEAASQAAGITIRADTVFSEPDMTSNTVMLCRACPIVDEPAPAYPDDVVPGDMHHGEDPMAKDYYERDACVSGVKSQLKGRLARTTDLALHYQKCHKPWRSDCPVCLEVMGVFKRNGAKAVDGHHDDRPGHTFSGDMITMSHRSRQGNKYLWAMRCGGGFLDGFALARRSELTGKMRQWITKMRADARFQHLPYTFFQAIQLDLAGEQAAATGHWMADNSGFNGMLREFDPAPIARRYDPTQPSAKGPSENIMRLAEITIKSILLQGCMGKEHWEDAWIQGKFATNIVPRRMDIVSVTAEAATPLTRVTVGRIDALQCRYWYKCFINMGILCMVKRYSLGSDLEVKKFRFGIVLGMVDDTPDLVTFFCPFRGPSCIFRSKHYVIFHRELGVTYHEFLGVEAPRGSIKSLPRPGDNRINDQTYVVTVDGIEDWAEEAGITTGEPNRAPNEIVGARGVAKPKLMIVDPAGNHWEPSHSEAGPLFRNVGPLLHRLHERGLLPPPTGGADNPDPAVVPRIAQLRTDPTCVVDPGPKPTITFYKIFDQGVFKGRVTKYTKRTKLWTVKYDQACSHAEDPDDDEEQLDFEGVVTYVICHADRPSGAPGGADGAATTGSAPAAAPSPAPAATMDAVDPYRLQPGELAPVWPRAVVLAQPHVVTVDGDMSAVTTRMSSLSASVTLPCTLMSITLSQLLT
jgi:hypothetical protein